MNRNSEKKLKRLLGEVKGADPDALREAAAYVQSLAAPPGSLGKLADAAVQLAGITGKVKNTVARRRIIVMCADNGVAKEGVSVTPQIVTLSQAVNMTRHLTGMSSLAAHFGDEVEVVDVGIATPYEEQGVKIVQRRIRPGTGNILKEPAMSREEALEAILVGIERAGKAKEDGIDVIGAGEMGIGNTTTSSAVLSALTGLKVEEVTGRGGGLTDEAFARKKEVIGRALELHGLKRDSSGESDHGSPREESDPIDVIAKVGGLDIAAMCGVYLGAAIYRIPVIMDGMISAAAALIAEMIVPGTKEYMLASHIGKEAGMKCVLEELKLKAVIDAELKLGEGTGALMMIPLLDMAADLYRNGTSFDEIELQQYERYEQ